jgi:hypothetical protein
MRISEDTADGRGLRIGLVTIAVQLLLAKRTGAARNIKRNDDMIAGSQMLNAGTHLLNHAGKFMSERSAYTRVGNQAVV